MDDTIYVAVSKDVEESKSTVLWALQNFHGKFCILHVHQPVTGLEENELRVVREYQKQFMNKTLDDYLLICRQAGVHSEKLHDEMADIGQGIVELIYQHNIKKLVMGAAADKHYTGGMKDLKSKKAIYVRRHMPFFCQIWFICRGHLIRTRDGDLDGVEAGTSWQASSVTETGRSNPRSPGLCYSTSSSSSASTPLERVEDSESALDVYMQPQSEEDLHNGEISDEQLYDQLGQALTEAEKSKVEAFEESMRRVKAEKTAIEAIRRAKALERLYSVELTHRKQIEEALNKEKKELEEVKRLQDEERLALMDEKELLESQVASCNHMIKELDEKLLSTLEILETHKKERDELQIQLDNVCDELWKKQTEEASTSSSVQMQPFFYEFSISEIQEATNEYDPSWKIAEGGYGTIYKGSLRQTPVAIKLLRPCGLQGPPEFMEEIDVLGKLRHPNMVTLIGACPDIWALIYEYLPNGSLEDRLNCKDSTPSLLWRTRICIAIDMCSVLIFLHSSRPHNIVHGNLHPGNILLDANFACKLSNFGISHAHSNYESFRSLTFSDVRDVFPYLDPQFFSTGELTPMSDVYAFGIILLQLLTGRSPQGLAEKIQDALDQGNLDSYLDPSAGDLPFVQAKRLAYFALRCCEVNRSRRPDLVSDVLGVLKSALDSCGATSSSRQDSEDHNQPPSYFICPIMQEVMQDPHVAADGFTYESEALKGWLDSGHDTSPMTNLRLSNCNLVPNRALRSAIQEWLQHH